MAELTDKTVYEGENCDEILDLLLNAFKSIEKGKIELKLIRVIFEFKFLQLCGFTPATNGCNECGGAGIRLYFGEYGLTCGKCGNDKKVKISETALYALRFILEKGVKEVFSFTLSDEVLRELFKASSVFMGAHSDAYIKSADFLT